MKNYRLYLVRHGVTQGNLDGIYMGSGTDQPLCAQGAAQLRALAARFPYPKAETVFSSPMRRAVETVELLFPDAKDKIILADLRENAFGEFEGRKVTELVQDAHFKQWMDPAQHYTPEGGEPAAEFHKRHPRRRHHEHAGPARHAAPRAGALDGGQRLRLSASVQPGAVDARRHRGSERYHPVWISG